MEIDEQFVLETGPGRVPYRDWTEDFSHENGNYACKCSVCGHYFIGHKRRVVCKLCVEPDWEKISKRQPPEDCKGNIAWAGAWLEGEMVGYARCIIRKVSPLQSEVSRLEGLNRELVDALTWSESLFRVLLNGSIAFTDTEKFNIHAITALLSRASSKEETTN